MVTFKPEKIDKRAGHSMHTWNFTYQSNQSCSRKGYLSTYCIPKYSADKSAADFLMRKTFSKIKKYEYRF